MGLFRFSGGQGGFPFRGPMFVFGDFCGGCRGNAFRAEMFEAVDYIRPILNPFVWIFREQFGNEFGKQQGNVRIPL